MGHKNKNSMLMLCGCATVALSFGFSGAAYAQDASVDDASANQPLPEIVVTAERRSVSAQKAPLAVSVIDGAALASTGRSSANEVLQTAPSVVVQTGVSPNAPEIAIRGVGTDGPGKKGATSAYMDGVLITQNTDAFFDIERVEVVRGPQGTLYGRGATGGTVNFITKDPSMVRSLDILQEIGSYNLVHTTAIINQPITDTVAVRVAGNVNRRDGYLSNGQNDANNYNLRVKTLFKPNDSLRMLVGGEYYDSRAAGPGYATLNDDAQIDSLYSPAPDNSRSHNTYRKIYGNFRWNFSGLTLTYIPAWQSYHQNSDSYTGGSENIVYTPHDRYHSQEIQLAGNVPFGLTWVAGLFYGNRNAKTNTAVGAPTTPSDIKINVDERRNETTKAIFGEANLSVTDWLTVLTGARQTEDKGYLREVYDITNVGVQDPSVSHTKFHHFDYKLGLQADLSPQFMAYVTYKTGYRPGGAGGGGTIYGAEVNKAVEAGVKTRWFANRVQLNASAYHYDYSGFQSTVPIYQNDDPSTGLIIGSLVVGRPATFKGAEVEMNIAPTRDHHITLSSAYLDGHFDDGTVVPHAPKWQFKGQYDARIHVSERGAILLSGNANYQSKQYVTYADPYVVEDLQKAYWQYNASIGYSFDDRLSITFYGKNLSNKLVKTAYVNGAPSVAEPRTYGVVLQGKF